LERCF